MQDGTDHIYVHVPFCDGKCGYCAFYSTTFAAELADRWVNAVLLEMRGRLAGRRPAPRTIYLGGGTPSVLSPAQFDGLARGIASLVSLSRLKEWTAEANPGSLSPALLGSFLRAGVNRISIGAQSMDDRALRLLGRRHSADDVRRTVRMLRNAGVSNYGIDLISGIPSVDESAWKRTVEEAARLGPAHVSVYSLTFEPGTPLARLAAEGGILPADDDTHLLRLDAAELLLRRAGYRRYEVSNYSLPGRACLHNTACWRGLDYLGFGPAAASRSARARRVNRPDLGAYLAAVESGADAPAGHELLDARTDLAERLMFAFRMSSGADLEVFCRRFGPVPRALRIRWERGLRRLEKAGLLVSRGSRWRTTRSGADMADAVASEFIDAGGFPH